MLKFLGTGNAYSQKNTSAYFISNNELFLFDCGETVFKQIQKFKLIEKVKKVNIFLTHLHSDHCGSIGSLIFYLSDNGFAVEDIKVFMPEQEKLYTLLTIFDVQDKCTLLSQMDIQKMGFSYFTQKHHRINSYGYVFPVNNKTVYFSGDTNAIPQAVLDLFIAGKIDQMYVETSFDATTDFHLYYKKLEDYIPKNLRKKVTCMHLKDGFDKKLLSDFNIAKVEE